VAEDPFRCGICLPTSSSLSEAEQLYVINEVRRAARAPELLLQRVDEHSNRGPMVSGEWAVNNVDKNGIEAQASKIARKPCGRCGAAIGESEFVSGK
jgi:hypothetical protein